MKDKVNKASSNDIARRDFLKAGAAAGLAGAFADWRSLSIIGKTDTGPKPNILMIICDQLRFDSISAHGFSHASTPNIDRLVENGISFSRAYTTNPVCSPARSSLLTGRMPCETGVITNERAINAKIPTLPQCLKRSGYETAYCGKWHLPDPRTLDIPDFETLPSILRWGWGASADPIVSRSCESYLLNREKDNPFFLVASFFQPHDSCSKEKELPIDDLLMTNMMERIPGMPPNHAANHDSPKGITAGPFSYSEEQWRYHQYFYYRQAEMVDAEIGRVLNALEASGEKDNTVVIFTSGHGESAGSHCLAGKAKPHAPAGLC